MPLFLSDPPDELYPALIGLLILTGVLWFNRQSNRRLVVFLLVVVTLAAFLVCDYLYESPREAVVRGVNDISEAINARDWNAFADRISDEFEYKSLRKADLRTRAETQTANLDLRTAVWNFNRDQVVQNSEDEISLVFDAKGEGIARTALARIRVKFVREADGVWRMKTFTTYKYGVGNEEEEPLPGL